MTKRKAPDLRCAAFVLGGVILCALGALVWAVVK